MNGPHSDFFVSYTSADEQWAEWISHTLEDAGYSVVVQAWDFRPGSNFVLEMQKALRSSDRLIAVLSPDYLAARYPQPEWAAVLAADPEGTNRKVVPVMVRLCEPTGLLGQIVQIRSHDLDDMTATQKLLDGVKAGRGKPTCPPAFPGAARQAAVNDRAPSSDRLPWQWLPSTREGAWDSGPRDRLPYERVHGAVESHLAPVGDTADRVSASSDEALLQPFERPSPARMYNYTLGGEENFEVDRAAAAFVVSRFPEGMEAARHNRLFLYRAVRFLARDAGIRQYLDMGSGLPTQHNVHQVAQQFQPGARVVYVDNDPTVLAHGRDLLAPDETTTFVAADMAETHKIFAHPQTCRLLDLSAPVAVLFLSVGHLITDDVTLQRMLDIVRDTVAPGSYVAFTQMVGADQQIVDRSHTELIDELQLGWKNRLAEDVVGFLRRWEPVAPGLVNITQWRPDPEQPPLVEVDRRLQRFISPTEKNNKRLFEFGGVVRKPVSS